MEVRIRGEYIKLEQAMKLAGAVVIRQEAAYEILEGRVCVNGETELRRGRKLRPGDVFAYGGQEYTVARG
jgi:ribosome-associated protein